ncbi:MAG TPA: FAD-binding oxidoreductase [Allosphingosinicella sp.]|nr:FAD-binding oxidoreductase [Allosphingosinicella sp.]
MTDVAIIGAGIAGASLAAALAGRASVLILEAERLPGYHATGRSAAFWSESYGGPLIRPLTSASGPALAPFLAPRGAIHLADAAGRAKLDALAAAFPGALLQPLGRAELEAAIPNLSPGWDWGLAEPSCADIDVAALHAACLKGQSLVTRARMIGAERNGRWRIETTAGPFQADILVNAAGAWADDVALLAGERPVGIQPYRRTIAQLRVDPPAPPDLPLVIDAAERFYFKPETGGRLWLSPHDETPCVAHDCAAEEIDVAIAVDRLEQVVDWRVEAVERKWAGLRSFAPDRLPVYGFSDSGRGFFWFAGQGGFGIQTAPAAARLAAALILGTVPAIDPAPYSAARFA